MLKFMGAKRKERDKIRKSEEGDKKWWKFGNKSKIKPMRQLDIQHNVKLNNNYELESESYDMNKYYDRDNNHYRRHHYDDNFLLRNDQLIASESTRDSLESSEISSDAFSNSFRPNYNNFNNITQHIQNNNNKITIIIKHNEDAPVKPHMAPHVIYIQPAATSQPNLQYKHVNQSNTDIELPQAYNSLDDLDSEEHYQFYGERAIDVPDDFKRDSYLVLNFNNTANKKLKRRICTPTRNLLPFQDLDYTLPNQTDYRRNFNHKVIDNQTNQRHQQTVEKLTQQHSTPSNKILSQKAPVIEPKNTKTFATQKKLLNEYYNWDVVFPSTTIHRNSILYRDAAQNESFRKKLKIMSDKMMTMGGRGQLGNDFGGSTKELSPRKVNSNTLLNDSKLARSEISLEFIKNERSSGKLSSSLINLITMPFSWRSRQVTNKSEINKDKKKPNMLMNLFKKRRVMCNEK
ncbi:CLUMA_CG002133, isoform A [Clunio marinus]|uniref:CLUMA_CG002133, isoform A n=1 Tax=Clunio marinus TaxID=568069 RepID=A0A1J1HLS3_9DIPT|nr:CLUMA_CG002133, isoform A [Clunio marinus]